VTNDLNYTRLEANLMNNQDTAQNTSLESSLIPNHTLQDNFNESKSLLDLNSYHFDMKLFYQAFNNKNIDQFNSKKPWVNYVAWM